MNWSWSRRGPLLPVNKLAAATVRESNLRQWFQNLLCEEARSHTSSATSSNTELVNRSYSLVSVAFPSYLNSAGLHCKHGRPEHCRSSLLDGCEQTLTSFSASTERARLVLPKKLKTSNRARDSSSHLPIPLLPLSKVSNFQTFDQLDARNKKNPHSTCSSLFMIGILFLFSLTLVFLIYKNFPHMDENELEKMKLPQNIEDAKELGRILYKYKNTNYYEVLSGFFVAYIFLQTFAIPGSIFLSILSGFLYPFYLALFLVCLCSGIGATGCFLISKMIGKPLINKYLSARAREWNKVVDGQREYLFNYLLFLRMTPFLPNWFINIVSPIVRIPLPLFFTATVIGVAPLSFIAVQGGTTLYHLTTAGDAFSWTSIVVIAGLALASLMPVALKSVLKKKFE